MSDSIIDFFQKFITNPYLLGVILSMVPLVELKAGIPAIYFMLGGNSVKNILLSFLVAVAGTSVLAPILLVVFIPLINALKRTKVFGRFASWIEKHFTKKSQSLEEKANSKAEGLEEEKKKRKIERAKYFGLFVFTAIPLPLTGCWTASCVAAIMRLEYKKSLLFIVLGNIVAGIAVSLITYLGGTLI